AALKAVRELEPGPLDPIRTSCARRHARMRTSAVRSLRADAACGSLETPAFAGVVPVTVAVGVGEGAVEVALAAETWSDEPCALLPQPASASSTHVSEIAMHARVRRRGAPALCAAVLTGAIETGRGPSSPRPSRRILP